MNYTSIKHGSDITALIIMRSKNKVFLSTFVDASACHKLMTKEVLSHSTISYLPVLMGKYSGVRKFRQPCATATLLATAVCKKIAAVYQKAHFWLFLSEIPLRFGKALNAHSNTIGRS